MAGEHRWVQSYPACICHQCGVLWGRRIPKEATYHIGNCDLCGDRATVTEPRDYGHLRDGWESVVAKG